jgi:hypothetical protein
MLLQSGRIGVSSKSNRKGSALGFDPAASTPHSVVSGTSSIRSGHRALVQVPALHAARLIAGPVSGGVFFWDQGPDPLSACGVGLRCHPCHALVVAERRFMESQVVG